MILEGLLTIQTEDDGVHTAAMGPEISDSRSINQLILKPFQSSRTSDLLSALPEGVFHLTDNVLLFAQAVTGTLSHDLRIRPADTVRGWILEDVCEAFEFRIEKSDTSHDRSKLYATIQKAHSVRPFRGFNRASHAVIEAAILFSRIQFLGGDQGRHPVGGRPHVWAVARAAVGQPLRQHVGLYLGVLRRRAVCMQTAWEHSIQRDSLC